MPLLSIIRDVCAEVGVEIPTAVIPGISSSRTMQEMLALANETAQAIAYDNRDWTTRSRAAMRLLRQQVLCFTVQAMLALVAIVLLPLLHYAG